MAFSSYSLIMLLLLAFIQVASPHICNQSHPACNKCEVFIIGSPLSLNYFLICLGCTSNRTLTKQGACLCNSGYYQSGSTTCEKCSPLCSTCVSQSKCTTCFTQQNRILADNSCVCTENYESKNNDLICKEKPNVLMIILSSLGSASCMVLGFFVCAYIRMRRGSQQIHADSKKRKNRNGQAQIEIYNAQNIDYNTSSLFWNAKNYTYKEGEICSICLDSNPIFMTDCEHYFHGKCIYSWFKNKNTCPNCNNQTDQKQLRRWCERCKKAVMPVIMNITISRGPKKSKKQQLMMTPVENQYCDCCQNELAAQSKQESLSHQASNIMEKQPESGDQTQVWR